LARLERVLEIHRNTGAARLSPRRAPNEGWLHGGY
jgi:hypothetical protein